jgi:hypothetical protein
MLRHRPERPVWAGVDHPGDRQISDGSLWLPWSKLSASSGPCAARWPLAAQNLLPFGFAEGTTLINDIAIDPCLIYADGD